MVPLLWNSGFKDRSGSEINAKVNHSAVAQLSFVELLRYFDVDTLLLFYVH
jgi:hypothetical protein